MSRHKLESEDVPYILDGMRESLEEIAAALKARQPCRTMAERLRVGLLLGVEREPARDGGVMLALAMKDTERCSFTLALPDKDADGQPLVNEDGTPWVPRIEWSTTDPEVASINLLDGDPCIGFIGSGKVGQATVTFAVGPYPDGSAQSETVNVSIGNSEPGPLNLALGTPELEPKPEQ